MNELLLAFEGPGGEALMAWCVQNGHIHSQIDEDPVSLVQHNFVKKLFHEAGIKVLPIIPRSKEEFEEKEFNLIDRTLEGDI